MKHAGAAAALLLFLGGCGSDRGERLERQNTDALYSAAERHFSRGENEQALAQFLRFAQVSGNPDDIAVSSYRRGEIYLRMGRLDDAERLFREVIATGVYEREALAAYRLGRMLLEERQEPEAGLAALRDVVLRYPDAVGGDNAIRLIALQGTTIETAAATVGWLATVYARLGDRQVGDNALWYKAFIEIYTLGDLGSGRDSLRAFAARYPDSSLIDDVLWTLGALYQRQGATDHAVATYRALLEIRNEASYLVGSYRSRRLDDAALMVGELEFHARGDFAAAEAAYRRLLDDFDSSVTRDDAWWGIAMSYYERGQEQAAAATLRALLAERPDSRFAERARGLLERRDPRLRTRPDPALVKSPLLDPRAHGDL